MAPTLPIFLLSCERSGSTLLRYILDIHPDICCPGELYMGRLVKCLRETVARTIGLAAGEKPEDQDWAAQREVHRMLSELMGKYAQIKGKKIWCDKTPLNLRDLAPAILDQTACPLLGATRQNFRVLRMQNDSQTDIKSKLTAKRYA